MPVCPKCGTQVPESSKFCLECGYSMLAPSPIPVTTTYADKPARSGRGKTILLISLAVLLLAGAALGVLFLTGVLGGNKDYDRAMDLYKTGSYEEAAVLFEQLGDYKDSADMARSSRYQQAKLAYQREEYQAARDLFLQLGDYSDSADWVTRCTQGMDYERAMEFFNQGKYGEAAALFTKLGDYRDSASRAEVCRTQQSSVVGVYKLTGVWMDGTDYSSYLPSLGYDNATITFRDDGTGVLNLDGSNALFRWNESYIDDGSTTYPYTRSADTVSFEADNLEMTFTRISDGAAPQPSPDSYGDGEVFRLTGVVMDGEDYSDYLSTLGYGNAVIVFYGDGTGKLDLDGDAVSFRWDANYIDDGSERYAYTRSGSTVSFEAGGVLMTFTRSSDGSSSPSGVYKLTGVWMDGTDYSEYLSVLGYDKATIRFQDDGTGELNLDGSPVRFRWDGSVLDDGSDKIPYTCSGNTVSFEASGVFLVFTK